MTKLAFIATTTLIAGFFGNAVMAQENAKGEQPTERTVTVFVDNDRVKIYVALKDGSLRALAEALG